MNRIRIENLPLQTSEDILRVRFLVGKWMKEQGFSLVDRTKMVTAASELARNALDYGGGGTAGLEILSEDGRQGIRLIFQDHGPGIQDVEQALRDGFSTSGGLGLGLGGSKRLVNEFTIRSASGEGTRVEVTRWK
ncbi:MAG: anti-sigma regulatory factor [Thermodesulfobacteriota bacterium]